MSLIMNRRVTIFLTALGVALSLVALWVPLSCTTSIFGTNCLSMRESISPLWIVLLIPGEQMMGPFNTASWIWYITGTTLTVLALVANNNRIRAIGALVLVSFFAAHLIDEAHYFLSSSSDLRRFFPVSSVPFWITLGAFTLSLVPSVIGWASDTLKPSSTANQPSGSSPEA